MLAAVDKISSEDRRRRRRHRLPRHRPGLRRHQPYRKPPGSRLLSHLVIHIQYYLTSRANFGSRAHYLCIGPSVSAMQTTRPERPPGEYIGYLDEW